MDRPGSIVAAAAAIGLFTAIAGAVWWQPWLGDIVPARVKRTAVDLAAAPSIAVLPFANLDGEPRQAYFADGLTEDLISDLSRLSALSVTARNAAFEYRGRLLGIKPIGRALGVRYLLRGQVRRAGARVRIDLQLDDTATGRELWSERLEGRTRDIFLLQDSIRAKVIAALALKVKPGEGERAGRSRPVNFAAYDAFLEGWARYRRFTAEDIAAAVPHLKRALWFDPEYGRAYAALGLIYFRACQWRWHQPLGIGDKEACKISAKYLRQAQAFPSALTGVLAARLYLYENRHEAAQDQAAQALDLDPNDPEAHLAMAWALITSGSPAQGLALVERAMRLDPGYPSHYLLALGTAHFAIGREAAAAKAYRRALEQNPGDLVPAAPLAASLARLGKRQAARAALKSWRRMQKDLGASSHPDAYYFPYRWPDGKNSVLERFIDGLHLAGLAPELTVRKLASLAASGSISKRRDAVRALGWYGPAARAAVPALIVALGDENRFIQLAAARSLGKIGKAASAAVRALEQAARDPPIRPVATQALLRIKGR